MRRRGRREVTQSTVIKTETGHEQAAKYRCLLDARIQNAKVFPWFITNRMRHLEKAFELNSSTVSVWFERV